MRFRIVEIDDKFYVEEKSIWSLFFWRRWQRFGGSFGDEDIVFKSLDDAKKAVEKYKNGENSKTYSA